MAALMAISAVSMSRISPTMMISGSWRRKAFRAAAKVIPTSVLTLTWLMPLEVELDRVLGGEDLDVFTVQGVQGRIEGNRLAGTGRSGDQQQSLGPVETALEHLEGFSLKAEPGQIDIERALVEDTQND